MKAKDDLAFLEKLLADVEVHRARVVKIEECAVIEANNKEDPFSNTELPPDLGRTILDTRQSHKDLLRSDAQLQEIARKYHRGAGAAIGDAAALRHFIDSLHVLIGTVELAVERELHPPPLHIRFVNAVERGYKAVFKTEREQVALRWILIAACAVGVLRLAGINLGEAIKFAFDLIHGKG